MTDEVAALVLADNSAQANALEIALVEASALVGVHARQIERLEQTAKFDRALEALPTPKQLQERAAAGLGLTAPGARGAARLHEARSRTGAGRVRPARRPVRGHRARELLPECVAHALRRGDPARIDSVARSSRPWSRTRSSTAPGSASCRGSATRPARRWRGSRAPTSSRATSSTPKRRGTPSTRSISWSRPRRRTRCSSRCGARSSAPRAGWCRAATRSRSAPRWRGIRKERARSSTRSRRCSSARVRRVGRPTPSSCARSGFRNRSRRASRSRSGCRRRSTSSTSRERSHEPVAAVAGSYFALTNALRLDWLRDRIAELPRGDRWQTEARAALRDELHDAHRELAEAVLTTTDATLPPLDRVDAWSTAHALAVQRFLQMLTDIEAAGVFDLTTLGVARRALQELAVEPERTSEGRRRVRRRMRSAPSAARAALAPHAPWTPPPGCADADARNRPRIGVSARPSPGTGRNTSCWANAIVPPPRAPPVRLASRASSAGGGSTCRAVMRARKPGARASISASIRSAKASVSSVSHVPRRVPPASPRGSSGTWL